MSEHTFPEGKDNFNGLSAGGERNNSAEYSQCRQELVDAVGHVSDQLLARFEAGQPLQGGLILKPGTGEERTLLESRNGIDKVMDVRYHGAWITGNHGATAVRVVNPEGEVYGLTFDALESKMGYGNRRGTIAKLIRETVGPDGKGVSITYEVRSDGTIGTMRVSDAGSIGGTTREAADVQAMHLELDELATDLLGSDWQQG